MADLQGIDVAKYQGVIDWKKVAKTKQFAILKVTRKDNQVEESFEYNYKNAVANNLLVGGYRYVYATTVIAARLEAEALVRVLNGRPMLQGIWLDMEDKTLRTLGKSMLTQIINTEAAILNAAGYGVGIYCNKDWYNNVLDSNTLSAKYPFWIARYPSNDTGAYNPLSTLSPKSYGVAWQYSSKGKVDGIQGNVDLDVAYKDLTAVMYIPKGIYYPKYTGNSISVITALSAVGEKDTSLSHRKKIGIVNGINNVGTVTGNLTMLSLLKTGKLLRE